MVSYTKPHLNYTKVRANITPAFWQWQHGEAMPVPCCEAPFTDEAFFNQPWMITPPLLNAHTHLDYTLSEEERSLAPHAFPTSSEALLEGERFTYGFDTHPNMAQWLLWLVKDYLPKLQAYTQAHDPLIALEATLSRAMGDLTRYGVGCIADIARSHHGLDALLTMAPDTFQAWISFEAIGLGDPTLSVTPLLGQWHHTWQQACHRWQTLPISTQKRIHLGLSPHSPYNVSQQTWHWLIQEAQKALPKAHPPLAIHTHALESEAEHALLTLGPSNMPKTVFGLKDFHQAVLGFETPEALWQWGNTPEAPFWHQAIESCQYPQGVTQSLVAHGVYDTHGIFEHPYPYTGRAWVVCPRSNVWLQGKTIALKEDWLIHHTLPFNLGTDSLLSTSSLDPREEARFLQRWWQEHPLESSPSTSITYLALWRAITVPIPALKAILPQGSPQGRVAWYWQEGVTLKERHTIHRVCQQAYATQNPEPFAQYLLDGRLVPRCLPA